MLGVPSNDPPHPAPGASLQAATLEQDTLESPASQMSSNHEVLSKLLYEGSGTAMREVFNTIHPPITLESRLSKVQILKSLRRLQQQGTLTPDQWRVLYPKNKISPGSTNFDPKLLRVLLQHVCHLSPPYPNGWEGIPLSTDTSLSADLVRLDYIRRSVIHMNGVTDSDGLQRYSNILTEVLTRIGGPIAKIKSDTIMKDPENEKEPGYYKELVTQWEKYHVRMMRAGADPISPEPLTMIARDFTLPQITTTHVVEEPGTQEATKTPVGTEQAGGLTLPGGQGAARSRSNSRSGSANKSPGNC